MDPRPPSRYIPTLDGWRGLAALAVMAHHAGASGRGYLGVDLFFALSGYLVTAGLLAEAESSGRVDLPAFWRKRAARILPAYLAYLAAVAALGLGGGGLAASLGLARNYVGSGRATEHLWSLAVEAHFYLIWPPLFALAGSRGRARRLALGLALAVTAWRSLDRHLGLAESWGVPGTWDYRRTDQRLDGPLCGAWMALVLAEPAWRDRLRGRLRPWPTFLAVALAGAAASALAECVPACRSLALPRAWSALAAPWLVASTALHPGSAAGRLLEWGPLRRVGRASYSLYLWQQLFLVAGASLGPFGRFPLDWMASFLCAAASYRLIERPFLRTGRRAVQLGANCKARTANVGAPPPPTGAVGTVSGP